MLILAQVKEVPKWYFYCKEEKMLCVKLLKVSSEMTVMEDV